jgi:hypothetical protein
MSTKQQFKALLNAKKPSGVSQTGMDMAEEYFLEQNWLERKALHECVRECIALARRFDSAAAVAPPRDAELVQYLRMAPQDLMTSDDLTEKIRPAVEQVRHTLFGSPCPPFPHMRTRYSGWSRRRRHRRPRHGRLTRNEQSCGRTFAKS